METTMHQPIPKRNTRAKSSNNTSPIVELINQTPSLEQYVIANILTKCGRPQDYDGKYKFILLSTPYIGAGSSNDTILNLPVDKFL